LFLDFARHLVDRPAHIDRRAIGVTRRLCLQKVRQVVERIDLGVGSLFGLAKLPNFRLCG
jgi:hypothetical protein